jgi:hypothetical protein
MAVSITQTANPAGVSAATRVATYTNAAIGTARPSRIVVVLVGTELASTPIESCTLGGTAMTAGTAGVQSPAYARAFYLAYPSGTTATVAVTFTTNSPTDQQNHIAVYSVLGGVYSSTGSNGGTDYRDTPLTTGSTTIATAGGMIAVASGEDAGANTWSGLTRDIDADVGTFHFSTATSITAGAATRTCTGATNNEIGAMSWLIFTALRRVFVTHA